MNEGLNPTRRYKWFRPRQAVRGYIAIANTTHFPLVALYNDSGPFLLVVRAYAQNVNESASGNEVGSSYVNGLLGTAGGKMQPLMPTTGKSPGLLTSLDSTIQYAPDWDASDGFVSNNQQVFWRHDFPFAVLEPGWSLVFQLQFTGNSLAMSMMWEAIYPDELDFAFEL